jgi:hypothetical protein
VNPKNLTPPKSTIGVYCSVQEVTMGKYREYDVEFKVKVVLETLRAYKIDPPRRVQSNGITSPLL